MTPELIDGTQIVATITQSTTGYLSQFSPVFVLMGGILLAVGVLYFLIGAVTGNRGYYEEKIDR